MTDWIGTRVKQPVGHDRHLRSDHDIADPQDRSGFSTNNLAPAVFIYLDYPRALMDAGVPCDLGCQPAQIQHRIELCLIVKPQRNGHLEG